MRIGIIGTGNMGQALGLGWSRAGHEVLFGTRDPEKGRRAAAAAGAPARAGSFDEAAAFGDVVLYTVRDVPPAELVRDPAALRGKIIVDCNNRSLGDDRQPDRFQIDRPPPGPSPTEKLAAAAPGARVVKAFSTIPQPVLTEERAARAARRVSVFICADDPSAKQVVAELAEALGFVAVDSGGLDRSWMVDGLADFLRFQIGPMGVGFHATLSLDLGQGGQS